MPARFSTKYIATLVSQMTQPTPLPALLELSWAGHRPRVAPVRRSYRVRGGLSQYRPDAAMLASNNSFHAMERPAMSPHRHRAAPGARWMRDQGPIRPGSRPAVAARQGALERVYGRATRWRCTPPSFCFECPTHLTDGSGQARFDYCSGTDSGTRPFCHYGSSVSPAKAYQAIEAQSPPRLSSVSRCRPGGMGNA